MKLNHLFNTLREDILTITNHNKINPKELNYGDMWVLLGEVSANRAYDDSHPRWERSIRVLPYDGRDYCWYYNNNANDDHVATLLEKIRKSF